MGPITTLPGNWKKIPSANLPAYLKRVPDQALLADLDVGLAVRFMTYFYACPTKGSGQLSLKSRALGLYDPFAQRSHFPAGRRLSCNVYTGCDHGCVYCYTCGYIPDSRSARSKTNFLRDLQRDLRDLKGLGLPPMPLHISNSTDPLQEWLEGQYQHTLQLLRTLVGEQHLFTTITLLTKNPARLTRSEYLDCLQSLEHVCVEVSLIFWDDCQRKAFEPGAPSVDSRLNAICTLRKEGVPVALRVDPLFPRNPLPNQFFSHCRVEDYGARSAHTFEDLQRLVEFAADTGCKSVIVSPLKVLCGRWHDQTFLNAWEPLYKDANKGFPLVRSFAYRLPDAYVRQHLIGPVAQYGQAKGICVVHCKENLISTL